MIQDSRIRIQEYVAAVVGPFATAAALLLLLLSFLEYFRRGFVSLFLDFRLLVVATLFLWLTAVLTEVQPRRKWLSSILVGLALTSSAPVLWKMLAPFGRLGLITFACGLAVLVLVFIASIRKTNP